MMARRLIDENAIFNTAYIASRVKKPANSKIGTVVVHVLTEHGIAELSVSQFKYLIKNGISILEDIEKGLI